MLKLQVGITQKIGLPDYSSVGAHCQLELEIRETLEESPAWQAQIEQAYRVCTRAVHRQLAKQEAHCKRDVANRPTSACGGNGRGETWGLRERERREHPASERQLLYIHQLADETGANRCEPAALAEQLFAKPLLQLTRVEASGLIELLLDIKQGKLDGVALRTDDDRREVQQAG